MHGHVAIVVAPWIFMERSLMQHFGPQERSNIWLCSTADWLNQAMIEVSCLHRYIMNELEMRANAQRDGRPVEYRWRPLFNAAVWLTPTTRVSCSNAAKTRKPLKLPGVPQTNERISATRGPKFTILWGHVGEILLLNKFFSDCRYMP